MTRIIVALLFITALLIGCADDNAPTSLLDPGELTVTMTAFPDSLADNAANPRSTITAVVTDVDGTPVMGQKVLFTTSRGEIENSATTDRRGRAVVELLPGNDPGNIDVSGRLQSDGKETEGGTRVCVVDAGLAIYIELTATPTFIAAHGTGGVQTSIISARVMNGIGEPVDEEYPVSFELINEPNPPGGCIINGVGQEDEVETEGGIVAVGLNSGTQIGGKVIRATTWIDEDREDELTAILTAVAVTGGQPFQIDVDVNDVGVDLGGGIWGLEVSGRVWDRQRNPVRDGIPVLFTVEPELANIASGSTGNVGNYGISTPGVAYAQLTYHSISTFDNIEISAAVTISDGRIVGAREHTLPLQKGTLQLNVDPGNWMFEDGNEDAEIRVWASLKDGHNILINNAPILFSSSRGRFFWFNFRRNRMEQFYPDPAKKLTGAVNQENNENPGQATVFLNVEEPDIFLDPFTLEVTVQVDARVEGYDDVKADPKWVMFTRHG